MTTEFSNAEWHFWENAMRTAQDDELLFEFPLACLDRQHLATAIMEDYTLKRSGNRPVGNLENTLMYNTTHDLATEGRYHTWLFEYDFKWGEDGMRFITIRAIRLYDYHAYESPQFRYRMATPSSLRHGDRQRENATGRMRNICGGWLELDVDLTRMIPCCDDYITDIDLKRPLHRLEEDYYRQWIGDVYRIRDDGTVFSFI
jgi:hypothetical protein